MIDKDIKEVAHFRKKLNGRRLDYDYKRGKLKSGSKGVTEDEVQASYEKLEESIQLGTVSKEFEFQTLRSYLRIYFSETTKQPEIVCIRCFLMISNKSINSFSLCKP